MVNALATTVVKEKLAVQGALPMPMKPQEFQ
jgi:hypothetical protein